MTKKAAKRLTAKQHERQRHREAGKYARVNPCYACDKSAGVDYYSHALTDTGEWDDLALCLCKRCADATSEMTDPDEFRAYATKFKEGAA